VKYINLVIAAIFTLIYLSIHIPPTAKFHLWLITFAIPVVIIINHILLIICILRRKISAVFYLIPLLLSINFLFSTFGVKSFLRRDHCATGSSFTLTSYNVSGMKVPKWANAFEYGFTDDKDSTTYKLRQWILQDTSDIKCYQEYFDNQRNSYLAIMTQLKADGYNCFFSADMNRHHRVGVLIASKFPIVRQGEILASDNGYNRTVYADLKIGRDTIRIVNMHLQSMEMKRHKPVEGDGLGGKTKKIQTVLQKLKEGVFERNRQLKQVLAAIDTSSYPVICAGDINEIPYSHAYHLLRKKMKSSFEERGSGFGFTYNGNTIQFLRIDNQFYTEGVDIQDFRTLRDVGYSDHFPLIGTYGVCNGSD